MILMVCSPLDYHQASLNQNNDDDDHDDDEEEEEDN